MIIEDITLDELPEEEGIVLLGCSDLQGWITGVSEMMQEEGISTSSDPEKLWDRAFRLRTSGDRVDLALTLGKEGGDIGKLALWRLRFGDCSWISDYRVNYRGQHHVAASG